MPSAIVLVYAHVWKTSYKCERKSGRGRGENSSSAQTWSKTIAPSESFKVHNPINAEESQTGPVLVKLFFSVWVGVRKNRFRHLQPLSLCVNFCGNQSDTTPGPFTFTFAHTSLKSSHFPHTFSLEAALSSGLQLEAGIWTSGGRRASARANSQHTKWQMTFSNKYYSVCLMSF